MGQEWRGNITAGGIQDKEQVSAFDIKGQNEGRQPPNLENIRGQFCLDLGNCKQVMENHLCTVMWNPGKTPRLGCLDLMGRPQVINQSERERELRRAVNSSSFPLFFLCVCLGSCGFSCASVPTKQGRLPDTTTFCLDRGIFFHSNNNKLFVVYSYTHLLCCPLYLECCFSFE